MPRTASGDPVAVLDACVLFPASLRDTLLRLAETPRQYIPKWSEQILEEVARSLETRRNLPRRKTAHLIEQIDRHFPEARVAGYEKLIGEMTNHPKDRHVVAAAIRSGAQVIVTSNLRDFSTASLSEWGVEAQHPDKFLVDLLDLSPTAVISKLHYQAATIGRTLSELLRTLRVGVPQFADTVAMLIASSENPGRHSRLR